MESTPASMALVIREISTLKDQNELRAESIKTRFDAMDKAVTVFSDNLTRVPTDVQKEITHLRALLEETIRGRLDSAYRELLTRLNGMDEAIKIVQSYREHIRVESNDRVEQQRIMLDQMLTGSLAELNMHFEVQETHFRILEEKFAGIGIQFSGRDTALAAALQAAKEAVGEQTKTSKENIDKSERNMLEAIKQQRDLLQTNYQSLNDKITLFDKTTRDLLQGFDIRLTRIESLGVGALASRSEDRAAQSTRTQTSSFTVQIIAGAIGIAGFLTGLIEILRHP